MCRHTLYKNKEVEGRTGNCKAYALQEYKVEGRTSKCAGIRFTRIKRWKGVPVIVRHTLYKNTRWKGVPVNVQAYALQEYKVEGHTGKCAGIRFTSMQGGRAYRCFKIITCMSYTRWDCELVFVQS